MEFDWNDQDINFDFIEDVQNDLCLTDKNESIIFLVDASAMNYYNIGLVESNIEILINSYKNLLKQKLLNSSKDICSLIFYNSVK